MKIACIVEKGVRSVNNPQGGLTVHTIATKGPLQTSPREQWYSTHGLLGTCTPLTNLSRCHSASIAIQPPNLLVRCGPLTLVREAESFRIVQPTQSILVTTLPCQSSAATWKGTGSWVAAPHLPKQA
jgi:hypothetical protein